VSIIYVKFRICVLPHKTPSSILKSLQNQGAVPLTLGIFALIVILLPRLYTRARRMGSTIILISNSGTIAVLIGKGHFSLSFPLLELTNNRYCYRVDVCIVANQNYSRTWHFLGYVTKNAKIIKWNIDERRTLSSRRWSRIMDY